MKECICVVYLLCEESAIIEIGLIYPRKALGAFNGPHQPVSQLLVAFVGWQVQPIEAGVCSRKVVGVAPLFNGEKLRPVAAIQLFETIHGHTRGSCDKLQQTRSHLIVEGQHHSPEPLDHDVVGMIVTLVQSVLKMRMLIH